MSNNFRDFWVMTESSNKPITKAIIHIEKWSNGSTYEVARDSYGRFAKGHKRKTLPISAKEAYGTKAKEIEKLFYRNSWNIKGIPIHSTPQTPIYYGFTIYGFSNDIDVLNNNKSYMKSLLVYEMKKWLLSQSYVSDLASEIDYESPQKIPINIFLNGKWKLIVEKNGRVIKENDGFLR